MNKNKLSKTILIGIVILLLAVGYLWTHKDDDQETTSFQETSLTEEQVGPQIYREEQYGIEITYPESWYEYGQGSTANADLLSWRGFIPDYDSNKSDEEQELFSIQIYNKNPDSSFDAPKQFITKIRTDEKWEQVIVNGYTGTKITNTTTNTVTDYVFEHNGKLYDFNASQPNLFGEILPTLVFF